MYFYYCQEFHNTKEFTKTVFNHKTNKKEEICDKCVFVLYNDLQLLQILQYYFNKNISKLIIGFK
jgi:hypothetical protein